MANIVKSLEYDIMIYIPKKHQDTSCVNDYNHVTSRKRAFSFDHCLSVSINRGIVIFTFCTLFKQRSTAPSKVLGMSDDMPNSTQRKKNEIILLTQNQLKVD